MSWRHRMRSSQYAIRWRHEISREREENAWVLGWHLPFRYSGLHWDAATQEYRGNQFLFGLVTRFIHACLGYILEAMFMLMFMVVLILMRIVELMLLLSLCLCSWSMAISFSNSSGGAYNSVPQSFWAAVNLCSSHAPHAKESESGLQDLCCRTGIFYQGFWAVQGVHVPPISGSISGSGIRAFAYGLPPIKINQPINHPTNHPSIHPSIHQAIKQTINQLNIEKSVAFL